MRRTWKRFGVVLGLTGLAVSAGALEIGTEASYYVELSVFPGAELDDQAGPDTAGSGSLNSHLDFGDRFYYSGEVYVESEGLADATATDGGNLDGTASLTQADELYMESMEFHASSSWSDTFTNNSGDALNYDFDFLFSGGTLALGGFGGNAMFTLDILLDGSSIWSRTATLEGDAHDINDILTNGGLDADGLAHSVFQDQIDNYVEVTFDPFSGNLDLGSYGDGDTFELTYNLGVWASTGGDPASVLAVAGDPFGVGFQGTVNSGSAPVPEPATIALLGMGLAGLGARRQRKRS